MALTQCQQKAADLFLDFLLDEDETNFILGGYSGTGKTYLTNYLIQCIKDHASLVKLINDAPLTHDIVFTATTNQAAKVLSKSIKQPATTIHKFLGLAMRRDYSTGEEYLVKTKDYKVHHNVILFIDEASMINTDLMSFINIATEDCKVVFIGDPYQLLPIENLDKPFAKPKKGCPAFEKDCTYQVRLEEVVRQAKGNPIQDLATQLRNSVITKDFQDIEANGVTIKRLDHDEFLEEVKQEFNTLDHNPEASRILAWKNVRVQEFNQFVRMQHTDDPKFKVGEYVVTNRPILNKDQQTVYATDSIIKVIHISDATLAGFSGTKYIFPYGSVFIPDDNTKFNKHMKQLKKDKDWVTFYQLSDQVGDLRSVYASTVHKSQGSTYDRVFIDLHDIGQCWDADTVARLLYVGVTRARKEVILYEDLPDKYKG